MWVSLMISSAVWVYSYALFRTTKLNILQYHPIVLPESPLVLWSWNQLCYLCLWNRPTLLYECHLTIPFTSWINNQQHVAWKNYELMYSQWGYDHITACVPLITVKVSHRILHVKLTDICLWILWTICRLLSWKCVVLWHFWVKNQGIF